MDIGGVHTCDRPLWRDIKTVCLFQPIIVFRKQMAVVRDISTLEALYEAPLSRALDKVAEEITPCYRRWIEASRFLVLSTVGPEGTDASPRGHDGAVVVIADSKTLLLPDWRGNNRLDSLRNIVRDGRVSLLFMVPGCNNVVRVNGQAFLTTDANIIKRFAEGGRNPKTVIVASVKDVYFQCAKALMRSNLWNADDESNRVPTAGQFIKEQDAAFDGAAYDANYADYAKDKMW